MTKTRIDVTKSKSYQSMGNWLSCDPIYAFGGTPRGVVHSQDESWRKLPSGRPRKHPLLSSEALILFRTVAFSSRFATVFYMECFERYWPWPVPEYVIQPRVVHYLILGNFGARESGARVL